MSPEPSHFEVEIATNVDSVVPVAALRTIGEIDLASAERFAAAFESERATEARAVVVDLREVTFIDSSGLRVLLGAMRDATGGFAVVVSASSQVERLLEISQVVDHLPVFRDADEALAAVEGDGEA